MFIGSSFSNDKFPDVFSSAGTKELVLLTKELGAFALFKMKVYNSELLFAKIFS